MKNMERKLTLSSLDLGALRSPCAHNLSSHPLAARWHLAPPPDPWHRRPPRTFPIHSHPTQPANSQSATPAIPIATPQHEAA